MLETVVTKALYIMFGFGFLLFISVPPQALLSSAKPYHFLSSRL